MAEGEANLARGKTMIERKDGPPPGREREPPAHDSSKDLFGVQLEVTFRLLEAEKRKLQVLQKELAQYDEKEPQGLLKRREEKQLENNINRIQHQYNQLEQEYRIAAMGVLRHKGHVRRSSRSQPAIGLKQTAKPRPSIFGTITKDKNPKDRRLRTVSPQMLSFSQMFDHSQTGNNNNNTCSHYSKDQALIFSDGILMAGTMEALIQHLVPTDEYNPDKTYVFAFLLSSRLFIRPHDLLNEVCQVCILQQNLSEDEQRKEKMGKFGPNIIQLLSEWADMFPYDFRDERMMKKLKEITQRILGIYPELRPDVTNITHSLVKKLAELQSYEDDLAKWNSEATSKSQTQEVPTTDITEICPSPVELAQQLTHIELERLSHIGPEEFVQAFSKESSTKEPTYKDMKKTSNLEAYVQWFNRLSYFVTTEICSHLKKKSRVRIIEYFVDVAKECINMGNFNSLMAIIAGMNMTWVSRLKKTWSRVNRAKFEILEHQMDPTSNFGIYRSCLKAAMWRSESAEAGSKEEKIIIPFFSLFVKDLYFLNEACSNKLPNGDINFEKFWQLAKQISDFITWQQSECPFTKNDKVINYLLTSPVFSESTLALASFECEAPEKSFEKEKHKQLKASAVV
ncbi:ras-GEF domain-containing family member 1B-like isoform X2 [Saccostrea cucullata]|uniref:ras-GEF domain-containing family member 1B-like isoform X2 n=1 Tax=Saccostrea cuccullata TaxID=36930 RepID=UPI002ED06229